VTAWGLGNTLDPPDPLRPPTLGRCHAITGAGLTTASAPVTGESPPPRASGHQRPDPCRFARTACEAPPGQPNRGRGAHAARSRYLRFHGAETSPRRTRSSATACAGASRPPTRRAAGRRAARGCRGCPGKRRATPCPVLGRLGCGSRPRDLRWRRRRGLRPTLRWLVKSFSMQTSSSHRARSRRRLLRTRA